MLFTSKKVSLIALAITALIFSRAMFFFFNDPEGPNLLVVMGAAAIVYVVSLAPYASGSPAAGSKKFWLAIVIQILLVAALYFAGLRF